MLKLIQFVLIFLFLIGFTGCSKKQHTPVGTIPVPDFSKPVDLLPSLINVRYNPGSSGVESCRTCHQEYYEEWKDSRHARATQSELFKSTSDHYKLENCMTCHSPADMELSIHRPKARDWKVEEGVTCSSCHVVENRTLGVLKSNAPHHTRFSEEFKTSMACASCHQPTYNQWKESKYAKEERHCQACHMPSTERFIANYAQIGYKKKPGHSHHFPVEYAGACEVDITQGRISLEQITVAVTNVGAGHDLPTGVFGDNTVQVELRILDGEKEIFFRRETLNQAAKNAIKSGETRRFFYNFRAPQQKSYLMVAKVYFLSSFQNEPIKLAEREQYYYLHDK